MRESINSFPTWGCDGPEAFQKIQFNKNITCTPQIILWNSVWHYTMYATSEYLIILDHIWWHSSMIIDIGT